MHSSSKSPFHAVEQDMTLLQSQIEKSFDQLGLNEYQVKSAAINDPSSDHNKSLDELSMLFYLSCYQDTANKADNLREEVELRQSNINFVNKLLSEIRTLRAQNDNGELDLSKLPDVQNRLKQAKGMGVEIATDQSKYKDHQCSVLIQNLNNSLEEWNKYNQTQTQKLSQWVSLSDQLLSMVKMIADTQDKTKKKMNGHIG